MTPTTMRAWRVEQITEHGEMHLRCDVPVPQPAPDQYLVRVEAAGLAFGDTLIVRGKYQVKPPLPFTPGSEVVGTIVAGVGDIPVGTRIASSSRQGGFAEYAVVPRSEAIAIDQALDAGDALALRSNFPTSLYSLRIAGKLRQGETLLVHAGAGGVGSAAVQLGKLMGARVIATAGGEHKRRACLDAGADNAIDYKSEDWVDAFRKIAPQGADVIYDPVGGDVGAQSLRCLAYGARYLVIGFAGGTLTQLPANRLLLHNASAVGVLWGEVRKRDLALAAQLTREVYDWHARGQLHTLPSQPFAFEQAREALTALEGRATVGKAWLSFGELQETLRTAALAGDRRP